MFLTKKILQYIFFFFQQDTGYEFFVSIINEQRAIQCTSSIYRLLLLLYSISLEYEIKQTEMMMKKLCMNWDP